jgi:hypothetical protein
MLQPHPSASYPIYSRFWDITQHVKFVGTHFGMPCQFHLLGLSALLHHFNPEDGTKSNMLTLDFKKIYSNLEKIMCHSIIP